MTPTLNAFDNGDVRSTTLVVYPLQGNMIGRSDTAGPQGKGYGDEKSPMFSLTSTDQHAVATTLVVRERAGKPGGGKGAMIGEDMSFALKGINDQSILVPARAYDEFNDSIAETHHTLRSGTKQSTGVIVEAQVRRLTPVECERLQGFPDNWTAGQADTHRYKQMGNAVAVPVVEWIIQNICDTLA